MRASLLKTSNTMNRIATSLLLLSTLTVFGQQSLNTKKVSIFKNGTALVVNEGSLSPKNGQVVLPIPPETTFGTYFLSSTKENSIKQHHFKNDTVKSKVACGSEWQYLAGNIGKYVTLSYTASQQTDKTLSGVIEDFNTNNGILKLKTDQGKHVLMHAGNVYSVEFKEQENNFYWADSVKRVSVLKLEKPTENILLQETYMTGGINWIPSYYLKLKDEKSARLEMKAIVENYAQDFKDADVELIVGAPQLLHAGTNDPMTYDYVTNTGSAPTRYRNTMALQSNAAFTMAMKSEDAAGDFFNENFMTEGEKSGDMYIYKLGKITLGKSTKGYYPVFAANTEYKDKYEGTIPDNTQYVNTRYCQQEEQQFDVFHSLEIKNTSTVPLTSASVTVVNEKEQLVAQDELKYTPIGSTNNIRLSKAIDIIMKNSEEEKSRDDNAKKIGKTNYSKAVIKGTIPIQNFQNKDITVSITKEVNGTVSSSSDNAKIVKKNSYNYNNPLSEIKWEITVKAGAKTTLNYEYEVLFVP